MKTKIIGSVNQPVLAQAQKELPNIMAQLMTAASQLSILLQTGKNNQPSSPEYLYNKETIRTSLKTITEQSAKLAAATNNIYRQIINPDISTTEQTTDFNLTNDLFKIIPNDPKTLKELQSVVSQISSGKVFLRFNHVRVSGGYRIHLEWDIDNQKYGITYLPKGYDRREPIYTRLTRYNREKDIDICIKQEPCLIDLWQLPDQNTKSSADMINIITVLSFLKKWAINQAPANSPASRASSTL